MESIKLMLTYRVGKNQVWVRGQTNKEDYRVGRAYTIRKDTFGSYCNDLLKVGNSCKKQHNTRTKVVHKNVSEGYK